jgi:hypothetical protein
LLSVPKGAERDELQRQAIDGHWTRQPLNIAIAMKYGKRRPKAGRPRLPVADVIQAQLRFTEFAQQWAMLRAEVQNAKAEQDATMMDAGHRHLPRFPPKYTAQLSRVDRALAEMVKMGEHSLSRHRSLGVARVKPRAK